MDRDIYKFLKDRLFDGMSSFDSWGSYERKFLYEYLKNKKLIKIENYLYYVKHKQGGGIGMGEYPPCVIVEKIDIDKAENITIDDCGYYNDIKIYR